MIQHGAGQFTNKTQVIERDKHYIIVSGCMVDSDERCAIDYVENLTNTRIQNGINPNTSVSISGTTLSITFLAGLYNFYSIVQLD